MPRSENDKADGQSLAILAESLYIANLLIIPVIGFSILFYMFLSKRRHAPPLARSHLEQTVSASFWLAGMFAVLAITIAVLKYSGMDDVSMWIIIVLAFTILHATMVLLGVLGLARAMAGKCWRYPLVGRTLPADCPG